MTQPFVLKFVRPVIPVFYQKSTCQCINSIDDRRGRRARSCRFAVWMDRFLPQGGTGGVALFLPFSKISLLVLSAVTCHKRILVFRSQ